MVKISDQELLDALEECYEEHGEVSSSILNDSSNEYPTQPTYNNRFGSLSSALEMVDIEPNPRGRSPYSREEIIDLSEKFYDNTGNIRVKDFSSGSNDLPSASVLYEYFDGVDELLKEADLYEDVMESRRAKRREISKKISSSNEKYTESDKERLLEHLQLVQGKHGKATGEVLSEEDGPSAHVYQKLFGSLPEAREQAGLERRYVSSFEDILGPLPKNVDENADGYIYVLLFLDNGERFYYVGKTQRLRKRLNSHTSGKSEIRHRDKNVYDSVSNLGLKPQALLKVVNVYKEKSEDETEFKKRLSDIEHKQSYKLASGLETSNIFGGR